MYVVGIDPGICGAAACLDCDPSYPPRDHFITDAIDLPTMIDGGKSKLKRRQIDERALAGWLSLFWRGPRRSIRVAIENVRAMPKDGIVGAFRFGLAAGQLRSTVRLTLGIEPEFVEPTVWKAWHRLKGGDKEASRALALSMFPESKYLLSRKMDHQRAEAMLIAKWASRPIIGR